MDSSRTGKEVTVAGNVQQAMLSLLRAGLWNREIDDKSQFPLSRVEWKQLVLAARQQTVHGIVFSGMKLLPEHLMPPVDILAGWMVAVEGIEMSNRKMNKSLISLVGEFSALGIIPVLQKGQGIALLYEEPLLRESGDIDLYFLSQEERTVAENHIKGLGIRINDRPDGSSFYMWKGFVVEHHKEMLDFKNRKVCSLVKERKRQSWIELVRIAEDDMSADVYVPCPEINVMMLDLHILKHVMGHGVGLRQLCDLARAYYLQAEKIDRQLVASIFGAAGIGRWNRLLHSALVNYIGMEASLPGLFGIDVSCCSDKLMEVVWSGGNFGQHRAGKQIGSLAGRKLSTVLALFGNMAFGLKYAPCEYIEFVSSLVAGQFGRRN